MTIVSGRFQLDSIQQLPGSGIENAEARRSPVEGNNGIPGGCNGNETPELARAISLSTDRHTEGSILIVNEHLRSASICRDDIAIGFDRSIDQLLELERLCCATPAKIQPGR